MSMNQFYDAFPKLAETELRSMTLVPGHGDSVPPDRYLLLEEYCNDKGCDCRRVIVSVFAEKQQRPVAHINLGFDSDDPMSGPFLDPLNRQESNAMEFLEMFTDMINDDHEYLARLHRHYVMYKEKIEGRRYTGPPFERPGLVKRVAAAEPPMPSGDRFAGLRLPAAAVRRGGNVGRNDPCPCGSGLKYKRCCMLKPQPAGDGTLATAPVPNRPSGTEDSELPRAKETDAQGLADRARRLVTDVVKWRRNGRQGQRWSAAVQTTLETSHALALPFLRLLLNRYVPDGRQRTLTEEYGACMDLLEEALTQIRYSVERNRPSAIAMAERIQTEIAEQAFRPEVDVRLQQGLILALHNAKLALHPRIREQAAEVAGYYARFSVGKGAPDLDRLLESLAGEMETGDPFEILDSILAEMEVLPVEDQVMMAAAMMATSQEVFHELVVLLLLHPNPHVRARLPESYRRIGGVRNVSAIGLRRMIGLRNWLPEGERPAVDKLIKDARLTGIASAPLPQARPLRVYASPFDGAGIQGLWLSAGENRFPRIGGALVKQGQGVREAWIKSGLTKGEVDAITRDLRSAAQTERVQSDFVQRLIPHFIAVGLDSDAPPPAQLLSLNEMAGGAYWKPEAIAPAEELDRLVASDPGSFNPQRVRQVLADAQGWPRDLKFAGSWFEDDARIDDLLREQMGRPDRWPGRLPFAVRAVIERILEPKRDVWAERLLWMAFWARACQNRPPLPWQDFLIVARALQLGTPLDELPLMRGIAERTIQSAQQRAWSR